MSVPMYKSVKMPTIYDGDRNEERKGYRPVYERVMAGEYEVKGDEGTKRMVSDEQTHLIQLLAMLDLSERVMETMERRLNAVPKGMSRLKTVKSLVAKLAFDIMNTAPMAQRAHIHNQMLGITTLTGVKAKMPRDLEREFGIFLNFRQLFVVEKALHEQCMLCATEDPAQQAKCPYAKLLDVLPVDRIDEDAGGCGWFNNWEYSGGAE